MNKVLYAILCLIDPLIVKAVRTGKRARNLLYSGVRMFRAISVIKKNGFAPDESVVGSFNWITIIQSEIIMEASGSMVAVAGNNLGIPFILVDEHFNRLSPDTRQFILWHEYGHITDEGINQDTYWKKDLERKRAARRGEVFRDELIADNLAIEKMGVENSVRALKELERFVSDYRLSGKDRELELRIQNARNQQKKEGK